METESRYVGESGVDPDRTPGTSSRTVNGIRHRGWGGRGGCVRGGVRWGGHLRSPPGGDDSSGTSRLGREPGLSFLTGKKKTRGEVWRGGVEGTPALSPPPPLQCFLERTSPLSEGLIWLHTEVVCLEKAAG